MWAGLKNRSLLPVCLIFVRVCCSVDLVMKMCKEQKRVKSYWILHQYRKGVDVNNCVIAVYINSTPYMFDLLLSDWWFIPAAHPPYAEAVSVQENLVNLAKHHFFLCCTHTNRQTAFFPQFYPSCLTRLQFRAHNLSALLEKTTNKTLFLSDIPLSWFVFWKNFPISLLFSVVWGFFVPQFVCIKKRMCSEYFWIFFF